MSYTSLSYKDFITAIKRGETDFSRTIISAPKSKPKNSTDTLKDLSFEGAVFPPDFAFFAGKTLKNCNFDYAVLNKASFAKSTLTGCSFERASLQSASFAGAKAEKKTSFAYADLRFSDLKGSIMKGISFASANLNEAIFSPKTVLDKSDFRSATLYFLHKANTASWNEANLKDALVNKNRASDRFKGAKLTEIRSNGQMDLATKKVYFSLITQAFNIKSDSICQKKGTEKKITDYALNALDKIGLRYSSPKIDKQGLITIRPLKKSLKSQKLLKELRALQSNNKAKPRISPKKAKGRSR